jgi:catechol 2,3-dioxygenase-like lactoylglutathione lyase family enzyme
MKESSGHPSGLDSPDSIRQEREYIVDWKLEVVTVPVTDLDRAKAFYVEKLGFNSDIDHAISDEIRLVQLTAPGSACSIHLGQRGGGMTPGSLRGLFLVVPDVRAARDQLVGRGVEASEVQMFDEGAYRPAREGENLDLTGCVIFSDPDGNSWTVQQIPPRS